MPRSVFTEAYASVVAALVALRKEKRVSQVELGKRIGRTQQFVSYVEHCERRIDVVEFYVIARALGADPATLFSQLTRGLPPELKI